MGPGWDLLIYEGNYFARAQKAREEKGKLIILDVFWSQTVYSDAAASSYTDLAFAFNLIVFNFIHDFSMIWADYVEFCLGKEIKKPLKIIEGEKVWLFWEAI